MYHCKTGISDAFSGLLDIYRLLKENENVSVKRRRLNNSSVCNLLS